MTTETFSLIGNPSPSIPKDPDAALDYIFNWTEWLALGGDSIASYAVTVNGVTKDSDARTGAYVTAWVSGGTAGETASVTCSVTTNSTPPRTDHRTVYLKIRER